MKAIRIAALITVCENPANPVIRRPYLEWSINLILEDIKLIDKKLKSGDIGSDDYSRIEKVRSICDEYLKYDHKKLKKLKMSVEMHAKNLIPRKYIQTRICKVKSFSSHKMGSAKAMEQVLQNLIDNGHIFEYDKHLLVQEFGSGHGKVYGILKL